MRILYEHRTQADCAEGEHIRGVVAALRSLGHDVGMLEPPGVAAETSAGREPASQYRNKHVVRRVLRVVAAQFPESAFEACELVYNIFEMPRLLLKIRKLRPHVLYVRYSLFTFAPAVIARMCRVPLVLEINDATLIERSRPLRLRSLARYIEKWVFHQADLWLTVSNNFASRACEEYRLQREKSLVLPNAVSLERFQLTRNPLTSHAPTLGVVGAFVAWHGLDFLLDAVIRLRRNTPDIRVLLVGDGPTRRAAEERVKSLGLNAIVEFSGFVVASKIPEFLQRMDICIIPDSNSHGSPMKLFEYMAMGKATVAPRYSPIVEVIQDGVNGLLFTPRDLDDFCKQTERLLQDVSLRRRIGLQARETVTASHTWVANVTRVLQRLQGLPAERGIAQHGLDKTHDPELSPSSTAISTSK